MPATVLLAFASRALIPAGFMPAADRPFSLEICPEGFPAAMLPQGQPPHVGSVDMGSMDMGSMDMGSMSADPGAARGTTAFHEGPLPGAHAHHHHPGGPAHGEHCVFGTACSAGPIPHLPQPADLSPAQVLRVVALDSIAGAVHLVHLPQPRAPPGRQS